VEVELIKKVFARAQRSFGWCNRFITWRKSCYYSKGDRKKTWYFFTYLV